jgi:hypothetical protein
MRSVLNFIFAILILVPCSFAEKLESACGWSPALEAIEDHERGIFVTIKINQDRDPNSAGGGGGKRVTRIKGQIYSTGFGYSGKRETYTKVQLSEKTIRYLILTSEAHPTLRGNVVSDLTYADLPKETTLELLLLATKSPSVCVRASAISQSLKILPQEQAKKLALKAIQDPCIHIARGVLPFLTESFKLIEDDPNLSFSDDDETLRRKLRSIYRENFKEIVNIASLLNKRDPPLISNKTLKIISSRAIPSAAWYQSNCTGIGKLSEKEIADHQAHFRRVYLKDD